VADETFIGGKLSNKHRQGRKGKPQGSGSHMTPVLSLVNKETGEVRSRVIPQRGPATTSAR
jgi:hypothetical protein